MTVVCGTCGHGHTTYLGSLNASACPDHAWTDACPYVGTACPPAVERADIIADLSRRLAPVKLSSFLPIPIERGHQCGACGWAITYSDIGGLVWHDEPNPDCPNPWIKRTPEEEARIAAAEAEAAAEDRAQRERHAWLLAHAPHPILRDLIEAHRPDSDDRWPDCAECPRPPSEHDGSDVPTAWPCDVWSFVSDRMETP